MRKISNQFEEVFVVRVGGDWEGLKGLGSSNGGGETEKERKSNSGDKLDGRGPDFQTDWTCCVAKTDVGGDDVSLGE